MQPIPFEVEGQQTNDLSTLQWLGFALQHVLQSATYLRQNFREMEQLSNSTEVSRPRRGQPILTFMPDNLYPRDYREQQSVGTATNLQAKFLKVIQADTPFQ